MRIAAAGAIILHCAAELSQDDCPYLHSHQHTHQEVYIPAQYSISSVTVATSATAIPSERNVYWYPDPARKDHIIYIYPNDVTASKPPTSEDDF